MAGAARHGGRGAGAAVVAAPRVRQQGVCNTPSYLTVIEDLSFIVEAGATVTVVGPCGSKWTTLMKLLAGLDTVSSGRILIGGQEVSGPSPQRGVIFGQFTVFPYLTVFANLVFERGLETNSRSR